MAYDAKYLVCVPFGEFDFGGTVDEIIYFQGPPGYQGRLVDIGVSITEDIASASLDGRVRVGSSTDDDAFGELIIPHGSADETYVNIAVDPDAILSEAIPVDQLIKITLMDGDSGGSATGSGHVFIWIEWYK